MVHRVPDLAGVLGDTLPLGEPSSAVPRDRDAKAALFAERDQLALFEKVEVLGDDHVAVVRVSSFTGSGYSEIVNPSGLHHEVGRFGFGFIVI